MGDWTDRLGRSLDRGLRAGREALALLWRQWRQEPPAGAAAPEWVDGFLDSVLRQYHFTAEAATWLRRHIRVEVLDRGSTRGGGFWLPQEGTVRLLTAQHEAAVHELAHAWWHSRRRGRERGLIEAVVRAAHETDRRYERVRQLAHGYVYGTPHDGWPGLLVDDNDWEMFAGLASGTMGDTALMPPYLRAYYDGLFERSA